MIRRLAFIFVVLLCILGQVCLKNADYLKTLYQQLKSPKKWSRVETVDERSMFEELIAYLDVYWDMFVVGLTASTVSFVVGWAAKSLRRWRADYKAADALRECLEEHCALHRRIEELEKRVDELADTEVSSVDCGGGECISETMNKANKSHRNGWCITTGRVDFVNTCFPEVEPSKTQQKLSTNEVVLEEDTISLNSTKSETEICKPDYEMLKENCEFDQSQALNGEETVHSYKKVTRPLSKNPNAVGGLLVNGRFESAASKTEISRVPPKEVIVTDSLDGRKCQSEKSKLVGDEVYDAVETSPNVKSSCSIIDTSQPPINKLNDSYQGKLENSCWDTETKHYSEATTIRKSVVDGNMTTVCDDILEPDLNNSKNFPINSDEGRKEDEEFLQLGVSQSILTVIDVVSPDSEPARSADWRDSSCRMQPRGRIPQYQKLHKEIKPDAKDKKNMRTSVPQTYIDERSVDVSGTQKSSPRRQNRPSTASGETLPATGGQRKKKQNYFY